MTTTARLVSTALICSLAAWSVWQTGAYVSGRDSAPAPAPARAARVVDRSSVAANRISLSVRSTGGVVKRIGSFGFSAVAVLTRGRPGRVHASRDSDGDLVATTTYELRGGRRVAVMQATDAAGSARRSFVIRYTNDGIRYFPARSWKKRGYVVAVRPFRPVYRRHIALLQYACLAGGKGEFARCP